MAVYPFGSKPSLRELELAVALCRERRHIRLTWLENTFVNGGEALIFGLQHCLGFRNGNYVLLRGTMTKVASDVQRDSDFDFLALYDPSMRHGVIARNFNECFSDPMCRHCRKFTFNFGFASHCLICGATFESTRIQTERRSLRHRK